MSVILDALKRVQDENRRRGESPDRMPIRPEQSDSALLRRLSEPGAPPVEEAASTARLSPAVWIALLVLGLAVVVVGTMWILQPRMEAGDVGSGEPLLSSLAEPAERESQYQSAPTTSQSRPAPSGFTENLAVAVPVGEANRSEYGGSEYGAQASPAGADMSDLSGRLGDEPAPAVSESTGFMSLESTERAPAPSTGGSSNRRSGDSAAFLDLSSEPSNGAAAGSNSSAPLGNEASPGPTGSARLPEGLVDPGVKAAFDAGVQAQKAGDLVTAEEAYKRALKFDPYNAKVNANLGVLYEGLNRFNLAESHLRRSINVAPDNANSHNNLGVVLYRQGNYDAAMIEFNRTLELDPRRVDAYTNKGLIYIRWGQHDEAERAFVQVLTIDPQNALAHYNLGMVYEDQELWDRAIRHYYEFVTLGGSDHPEITAYLGDHLAWLEGLTGQGSEPSRP